MDQGFWSKGLGYAVYGGMHQLQYLHNSNNNTNTMIRKAGLYQRVPSTLCL